ncbi:MAG: gliding motility-associated C-terminal domain-containing protein [Ferruginibacter sp.]
MKTTLQRHYLIEIFDKRIARSLFLLLFIFSCLNLTVHAQKKEGMATAEKFLHESPLRFVENKGQLADITGKPRPDILFSSYGNGAELFFHATGIDYQFSRKFLKPVIKAADQLPGNARLGLDEMDSMQTYQLQLRILGANKHATVVRDGEGKDVNNYYLAHCAQGIVGVKNYQKLTYKNIYPGIDWVIYSRNGVMEYDFVVHPGGKVDDIRLQYNGADRLSIDETGRLEVNTVLGKLTENKPYSYLAPGKVIGSRFKQDRDHIIFDVEAYDHNKDLVIDPSVLWGTYYGGVKDEVGKSCATDNSGNVIMTGTTQSLSGIATAGGLQTTYGGGTSEAFLVKFAPDGSRQWATYYGGTGRDEGIDCTSDASGNIYMTGATTSTTVIASGGFQNVYGGGAPNGDAYLVKFSPTGTRLWGTYYGGTSSDAGYSCVVDHAGDVYMAGEAHSSGLGFGGFSNTINGFFDEAILVKFSAAGARIWATYYGGEWDDAAYSCAVDQSDNVYIAGSTASATGIASGGFQNAFAGPLPGNSSDAFLAKFTSTGARLWATYYGAANNDLNTTCQTDNAGNVYLYGATNSTSGISFCGFQNSYGGGAWDRFLTKFTASGSRAWSTYVGGSDPESIGVCKFGTDQQNNIYVTSGSSSTGMGFGGFQNTIAGLNDAFITKFTTSCTRVWTSYYGGNSQDYSFGCVADLSGNIYITGNTQSSNGIASGSAYQSSIAVTTGAPLTDAFLVRINNPVLPAPEISNFSSCISATGANTVTLTGINFTGATAVSFGDIAAASFTVVNSTTITAVAGAGASGSVVVTTPYGTATICGFVYCSNPPSVSITANPGNIICPGTSVTFTATPVNAGTLVVYQWIKNAINVGTNSATYTDNSLNNGDIISCTLVSSGGCTQCSPAVSNTITMVVTGAVIPAVSIVSSANNICAGTIITFTATPVNGGSAPSYQWHVNGINVGTNASTFTTATLANTDIVSCTLTSNIACAFPLTALSNNITMIVNAAAAPSITINASANNICPGTNVTFTATPANGGTTPIYQWHVNGINAGTNSSIFTSNTLLNGDIVSCTLTSNANCTSPLTAVSNNISMNVNASLVPSISINASANNICAGTNLTFTATPVNGGTTPAYQWKVNGINVGTNSSTFTSNTLLNGDIVSCTLTSNANCASPLTATSNNIVMIVNASLVPSVTINASANNICTGTNVTFTATPVNGGTTPAYQWKVNGINVGTNSSTFTSNTLLNGDIVSCTLTSNANCVSPLTAVSNNIVMIVNASLVPSVTINASANNICTGTNVTFTATPVNGGTAPSYQWKINGINVGTNSSTFTSNTLLNGDMVSCVLTSNSACASPLTAVSNNITMVVTVLLVPSITISASANNICAGTSVTFTATPVNGGTTPSYQWKINGINAGTNSSTFTSNTLVNGDIVSCTLTSNSSCASPLTAVSNNINMVVSASLVPSLTISASANNICSGTNVTFTATPVNGGTTPSYQWKINGINVGTNSSTFASNTLLNGDIVSCTLTSNATCASPLTALSNSITMIVNAVLVPSITISATANNICSGTSVTFTATAVNGGTAPSYQWKVNGMNVGTNNSTFTNNGLSNGDIVSCTLTSNNACASPLTALSNNITMIVNTVLVPSITISGSANNICSGTNVTFTAIAVNGGATPSYQWKVNGLNVGTNNSTFASNSLLNGDIVSCTLTSNASCASPLTVASNNISMVVTASVVPSITISTSANNICTGTNVIFTATPVNGGTSPFYQWKVNGMNVGTNNTTFASNSLLNGDIVSCTLTSNGSCITSSTALSNNITMIVNAAAVPSITISVSANNICAGTSVTFTATPVNGGTTPVYQWKVNGMNVGANASTFTTSTLTNGDIVSCTLTSNGSCVSPLTALSNNIIMIVNASAVPSITISASTNNICAGTNVTFTATPVNEGVSPTYQWQINGIGTGANTPILTIGSLSDGAVVTCILTPGAATCSVTAVTSNSILVAVSDPPVISVTPQEVSVNAGTQVQLSATVSNTASYEWSPSSSLINASSLNPVTIPLNTNTEFIFKATSAGGCVAEQKIIVHVLWKLFMPTTFTPNADGINDLFRIPPQAAFDLNELVIYNRWGKKIFATSNREIGWDGTFSGQPCETGTYIYILSGRDRSGIVNMKGNILLVR